VSAAVLAADGGGSKTDVALLAGNGRLLASVRARGASFHPSDHDRSVATLTEAVHRAAREAGLPNGGPVARVGAFCLAGADLPVDERRMLRALRSTGLVEQVLLRNDTFAVLRAGTELGWGISVVCGTGLNCAGVSPDGRAFRFPALGPLSGDWGGGGDLAIAAVGACARARDGRGPRTALEPAMLEHFGMKSPWAVIEAIHTGAVSHRRVLDLAKVALRVADTGDPVAEELVTRLADEVASMIGAAARRVRVTRRHPDVVLGGGVARSRCRVFHARIAECVEQAVPGARLIVLRQPPVVGAALLGFDVLDGDTANGRRAVRELTAQRST
jgi:N-acetylglucosamine kinase-like BadF-type ATPase